MRSVGLPALVCALTLTGCQGNQVTGPSNPPTSSSPPPVSGTSGTPLNASPIPALPEGARLVTLGEPVTAIVSKTDDKCRDGDPLSDVNDPCQRFYVRASENGVLYISVTWDPTGDYLSLRAQNKWPVLTSTRGPLNASGTVTAGLIYAFEVGMHDALAASSQPFTFVAYQP